MKLDKVIVGGCALLVFTGYILGSASGFTVGGMTKLKAVMELGSFLATIAACCVAIYSLNSWRRQFRHSKEFEVLVSAHNAINGLSVYRRFAMAYMSSEISNYKEMKSAARHAEQAATYAEQWDAAKLAARESINEICFFAAEEINCKLSKHFEKLCDMTYMTTFNVFDTIYEEPEPNISRLIDTVKAELEDAEKELIQLHQLIVGMRTQNLKLA